jgi:long-subunit fatty acid transport protein
MVKKLSDWNTRFVLWVTALTVFSPSLLWAETLEMPSSWTPVGSGARALGMGGAFIAVADDATAASWNPGGLTQLEMPEESVVFSSFRRDEDNSFDTNPEANGSQVVSEDDLNYFSLAYPFSFHNYNMVVSINHQHLIDFYRKMNISLDETAGDFSQHRTVNESHEGQISALGLAYAVRLKPDFSLGLTLNFWEDFLGNNNGWHTTYKDVKQVSLLNFSSDFRTTRVTDYSFSGLNANIGFLWNATPQLTIGSVLKTPFKADVEKTVSTWTSSSGTATSREDLTINMPASYGLGAAYRFSDSFTLSADYYWTNWPLFEQTNADGTVISPITNQPVNEADIDSTHQLRLGGEYLFMKPGYIVPLRGGIFWEQAPAISHPDNYYGFSIGTGAIFNTFVFDIAYQMRSGHNVGRSIHRDFAFSQDTVEHTIYTSIIIYFGAS